MPVEVFPNVAESTLSVAATNVATTFTLASGAPFNTTGQFRLRLDDSLQQGSGIATRYEICRATFNAGNVVNVFRSGADLEGTTAQAWPIGTKVVAIVTAAGLANMGPPYAGPVAGGPPTTGAHLVGEVANDTTLAVSWVCTAAGTPGTWKVSSDPAIYGVGGGFVGSPPALTAGRFLIQAGSAVFTTNGTGGGTIAYPVTFPNGVVSIVCTPGDSSGSLSEIQILQSLATTAGATVQCLTNVGANVVSANVRINWVAVGW